VSARAAADPAAVTVRSSIAAPPDWDARTVDVAGGHVLQGTAWATQRAEQGWTPRFVTFDDGRAALVVTHAQPPLPGFVAYAPRGPVSAGDPPVHVAQRAVALATWLGAEGATILAVDPELDADPAYDAAMAAAGFTQTEELQPSRHRLVLRWEPGDSAESVLGRVSKQTRQRIRAATTAGTRAVEDPTGEHLEAFGRLADATAERKGFDFATSRGFDEWWRLVLAAGQARFWVATNEDELLGGLLVYRQAGHLATAFSADRADLRRELPGTMHLLRWTAIEASVAAGYPSIDLGGVDVRGARHKPEAGDAAYGLYEHKTSFGAEWVESAAAHEIVLRPLVYRAGLVARACRRRLRGRR
jgi:lipid II:glycine glycyltransferase (peptidoglycan interpeptide bridge formation enzyme)